MGVSSVQTHTHPLPTELIDNILEHLYYSKGIPDKSTLRACSLVSTAWTESAQRLLFRQVILGHSLHGTRRHASFLNATNPSTERGRCLGQHVRVLEIYVGDKTGADLDDTDFVDILCRAPRLYELALRVAGVHQLSLDTTEKLMRLATSGRLDSSDSADRHAPLRIRSLVLLSCGIQSPILYQLLQVWPCVEFLYLGVEIATPPPRWTPKFSLYQLTLMRTPRYAILSWLLSSSTKGLRIVMFRDAPGRDIDPLLEVIGPRLRSLRLMNFSPRATAVLKFCANLEELVIVQMSTLFQLDGLPPRLEHLSCRNLPSEDQSLGSIIHAVGELQQLRVVTCDPRAGEDTRFGELGALCESKNIELLLDETPFWVREDSVYVDRFPRSKSVGNFALMN
ncbi:hypothetical protein BC628DRAFT_1412423 [Trametes gibbosa]|nr:hypothetical protein BC628DRAFT_1412423 [Trametes gibbosa]